ncbi:hypothetical protein OIK40_04160 [Erythrobacter sp. sf7]|uniref:Uncharacterized protein n=1 Tax=Erythrobacter fulvus TaxID=2987523 RepID=A0ABT5JM52_9SPHN|nr:hypothetical protein [Erythrobacter fulvus]MDC8753833.1 hypothetical protein [Erythrobacter fulvus]
MEVPDELKADSGIKSHVRDAIRPHLDFIAECKSKGISEAAIYRHLLKKGYSVGSRSGFGAALKFLLKEQQEKGTDRVPDSRLAPSAGSASPHPQAAVPSAEARGANRPEHAASSVTNRFADEITTSGASGCADSPRSASELEAEVVAHRTEGAVGGENAPHREKPPRTSERENHDGPIRSEPSSDAAHSKSWRVE